MKNVFKFTPGCFAKPLNPDRTEWSEGIDAFMLRCPRGFCEIAKQAAPSLREMEKLGPWFTLSRKTGETRPNGTNRRQFLGAVLNPTFLNEGGEASKALVAKVRAENSQIGEVVATGDELIKEGFLGVEDFEARGWDPDQTVFLLRRAAPTSEDRDLWWQRPSHAIDAPPIEGDNLPF